MTTEKRLNRLEQLEREQMDRELDAWARNFGFASYKAFVGEVQRAGRINELIEGLQAGSAA